MPSPYNITNIPAPRVDFIDSRTGLMAREWYRFFFNLFNLTGAGTTDTSLADLQIGPPAINAVLGELGITYDQAQLASMMAEYEQATRDIQNRLDTAPASPQLGTLAAVNEDNVRLIGFSTNPSPAVPVPAPTGTLYWDGNSTLGLQMNQGVLAKIGQSQFTYVKASAAITKGQLCKHTGSVGSSGVITAAPTSIGMTDPNQIVGVAAEDIALNAFGFIQDSGDLRGFDTTGSSVGEVWADGDPLYYNPAYVGSLTNVKPSAPNLKSYVGEVINAGSGGSGSIHVRMSPGSVLGGTDSNVQFGTLVDKDLIQYDNTAQYWKNVSASSIAIGTATNLSGGAAGSLPYQSGASTTTFLAIGTNNYVLTSNGTAPIWSANTGTGNVVRATSPTLTTPTLGMATATSINKVAITAPATGSTLTIADGKTLAASNTLTLTGTDGSSVAFGAGGTVTYTSNNLSVFAATTSAQLAGVISDETGSGPLVFGTSPTIATPTITTSATVPLLIGGTGTTSTLTLRSTSGVGTTGADIIFQTGNNGATEAMRILNSGNVGIGTASPVARLDIQGTGAVAAVLNQRTDTTSLSTPLMFKTAGFNYWAMRQVSGALTWYQDTAVGGTTTEYMRIDSSGNVGIGTTTISAKLDVNGNAQVRGTGTLLVVGTGGLGYGTGSGGAVTQTISRTTGVTLNKTNGAITLVSAAGTTAWQTFTVTNNTVAATDTVIVNQKSGTDLYEIHITAVAAGSFNISFKTTGGTTTEQPVFNFAVIKSVTS